MWCLPGGPPLAAQTTQQSTGSLTVALEKEGIPRARHAGPRGHLHPYRRRTRQPVSRRPCSQPLGGHSRCAHARANSPA